MDRFAAVAIGAAVAALAVFLLFRTAGLSDRAPSLSLSPADPPAAPATAPAPAAEAPLPLSPVEDADAAAAAPAPAQSAQPEPAPAQDAPALVPPVAPGPRPLHELAPEALAFIQTRPGLIAVAIIDLADGRTFTYAEGRRFALASVAKVPIMLTLLERAAREGVPLTEQESNWAMRMITISDNASAATLWRLLGRDSAVGLQLEALGFAPLRFTLVPDWGDMRAGALDMARLFAAIADGSNLAPSSQETALRLLRSVVPEQAWGVSAGLDGQPLPTSVALKNGQYPDPDGWRVHSAGLVAFGDGPPRYALAILTGQQPSFTVAKVTIEGVAERLYAALDLTSAPALAAR